MSSLLFHISLLDPSAACALGGKHVRSDSAQVPVRSARQTRKGGGVRRSLWRRPGHDEVPLRDSVGLASARAPLSASVRFMGSCLAHVGSIFNECVIVIVIGARHG